MNFKHLLYIALIAVLSACSLQPDDDMPTTAPTQTDDRLLVLCEGLWGLDNSTISYIDRGTLTNKWYQQHNPGQHLGDTGNDLILVDDTLIAISVNWSNIIQYIHPDGTAITATEDIPNNRCLATDGKGYLYCTSYARNGYVAKIDLTTKRVVATCNVGYEPDGIAYYEGKLFIANTGGYAFQEDHGYEQTISVVDTESMRELKRINTGCPNLYGKTSQNGQFLCINSRGDGKEHREKSIVLNMASEEFQVYDFPTTYSCAYNGKFYTIGAADNNDENVATYSIHTISLPSLKAEEGLKEYAAAEPVIKQMQTPYGIYISPYSGHLYVADARGNSTNGYVYEFDTEGKQLNCYKLRGLNPGHFLALPTGQNEQNILSTIKNN